MRIARFATEDWFAEFEFTARHLLAASDCESLTVGELLAQAGAPPDALASLPLGYTEPQGSEALRRAIAARHERVDPDHVVVLNAPQEGIFLTVSALIEPGDAVIAPAPCYDSLRQVAAHLGARVVPWAVRFDGDGYRADLDELRGLLAEHEASLVILNWPHNPTGHVPSAASLEAMLALCEARGARVFSDEMYRGLFFTPSARLPSVAELHEGAVTLGGLSKAHGLPGLRCGWLVVPDAKLRQRIITWKNYTSICPPAPSEALALHALACEEQLLARSRARIAENVALAGAFFADHADVFRWRKPLGGSVALLETGWSDAAATCRRLAAAHGVVLLPGAHLGAPPHTARIGLGRRGFAEGLEALGCALRTDDALRPDRRLR